MDWKEDMYLEKMRLLERRISERIDRLSFEQEQLRNQVLHFLGSDEGNGLIREQNFEEEEFRRFETPCILVIHDGTSEASLAQYIGRLKEFCPDWKFEVRLWQEATADDILRAALIVCVRWLGELPCHSLIQMFQIPMYYYTDDCFAELQNPETFPDSIRETVGNTNREFLSRFSGVILSTPALRDAFCEKGLHERLYVHPFIFKKESVFPHFRSTECIRAAFYGGAHRVPALLEYVLPALERLSSRIPVELYLPPIEGLPADLSDELKIITLPYMAFEEGLRVYAGHQIDLLLYPSLPQKNNRYKDYNALFSAVSLDAVLIGSRDEPLTGLANCEAYCILAENSQDDWGKALQRFWSNPEEMQEIKRHARNYCEKHSGEKTIIADYRMWLEQATETSAPRPMRGLYLQLFHRQMVLAQELEQQRQSLAAELEQQRRDFASELEQQHQDVGAELERLREEFRQLEQRQQYQQAISLEQMRAEEPGRLSRLWIWLRGGGKNADLTASLRSTQPAFLEQLRQNNSVLTSSHCLTLSCPLPFHTYVEYSMESGGIAGKSELCFFVFASPRSAIFLEAVKDSQIVKQEIRTLSGDGEVCWPLETSGGTMQLRLKTLDNFSIVRVLEMTTPRQRHGTMAYYFRKSGESK